MKICGNCNIEKALDDFAWRSKEKGTKHSTCKDCRSSLDAKRYTADSDRRESIRAKRMELRNRNLAYMRDFLSKNPCTDCGNADIRVLDFDHLKDKVKSVSILARVPVSIEKLKKEIDKCEVRCSNCHRIKTYERAGWQYAPLTQLVEYNCEVVEATVRVREEAHERRIR